MAQNFDDDVIIMTRRHYRDTKKNMKYFKYCAISLNKLIQVNCVEFGVYCTNHFNLQKISKQIYLYIEQCFVCTNCTNRNKTVTFGCLIDMGVACKPYKTPQLISFCSYFAHHSLISLFANGNILSTPSNFIRQCKMNIQNFCLFVIFVNAVMLGAI